MAKKESQKSPEEGNLPMQGVSQNRKDRVPRSEGPTADEPEKAEIDGKDDPDQNDVGGVLAEDERAFESLVRKYQNRIFNLAYRLLGSREEAEELTQEIFLKVYRQIHSFRGDSLFSTWLYQVASNHCKNRLKYLQRRKQAFHDSIDAPIETEEGQVERAIPDETKIPEDLVGRRQIQKLVGEMIQTLPEDYRIVVVLRDIQGLAYDEIAQITGTVEGTVKSRLHRARMELKERLKPYYDPSMLE